MNSHEKSLLAALLDKYERTNSYRQALAPARRILLRLYDAGKTDYTKYNIENSQDRIEINRAVFSLSTEGLIQYEWMKGEENHIISKVWLNPESISRAYSAIGVIPKGEIVDDVCLVLLELFDNVHTSWIKSFLNDAYNSVSRTRSIGTWLPMDPRERKDMLIALQIIDQAKDMETLERVFSMKCFGDSKRFEQVVKSRLTSILAKYLDVEEDSTNDVLLRLIGITKYPEQFEFCGPVTILFSADRVDYTPLHGSASLSLLDLDRGDVHISDAVTRILSIENRANYFEYIRKGKKSEELVLFHGGQFSPSKGSFLQAISNAMPTGASWYHWGDIDYGGFSMLARLRREINPQILSYRMSQLELARYASFSMPLHSEYMQKLKKLKQSKELIDCYDCLDYMIEHGVKLEQEAMLTDSVD